MRLSNQLIAIVTLASLLGVINNFRPKTRIPWIQQWASVKETEKNNHHTTENVSDLVSGKNLLTTDQVLSMLLANQNQGPTDIFLRKALSIFRAEEDMVLWIDARNRELYEKGHIPGAVLLDFYDQQTYVDEVEALIAEKQPIALVLYCLGNDCPDSHLLGESLTFRGHENIFVYKGGWAEWYDDLKLPVEGTLESTVDTAPKKGKVVRKGMYLEEILRDLLPFFIGLIAFLFWNKTTKSQVTLSSLAIICGMFFIWAAVTKILAPFTFAKDIWGYDMVPSPFINIMSLILPWIELLTGAGLILGFHFSKLRPLTLKGSSLVLSFLLVVFIIVISINVMRGLEFSCGCTGETIYFASDALYFSGWNDKITLLLRDAGLLVMSTACFLANPLQPEKSK
ncbi:MAG: hypothetical protein CSA81_07170 [Acidobacteria bacterium]|nr:MAG: hypothetical protein CSA81_07170 [Acidobacteriota bacterium]